MTSIFSRILLVLCLIVTALLPPKTTAESLPFTLAPRIHTAPTLWMQNHAYHSLSERGQLSIGVSEPDYPPFSILDGERLQGITADYLGLLFKHPVRIVILPSRTAVLEAVQRGDIDMAGGGTTVETQNTDLQLSTPYFADQPVLVSNKEAPFDALQPNTLLAITPGYLPEAHVTAAYPNSRLLVYASPRRALDALSLGEIDAVITDAVSAHYLISVNYLINLTIQGFTPLESGGFGFLLRKGDQRLLEYLNQAVPKVSEAHGAAILRSWSGGRQLRLSNERIALSAAENRWLAEHPRVPVVLNDSLGALGNFDVHGNAQGIGPDFLALISQRSGLQFDYLVAQNYTELDSSLANKKALLTPVYAPSSNTPESIDVMLPYLRTSVIVMGPAKPNAVLPLGDASRFHHLSELTGKRVAIVDGYFIDESIRQQHPDIELHRYPTLEQALQAVVEGKSDVFVGSDYAARFTNALQLNNQLELIGILDDYSRPVSLAVRHDEPELLSILDKAQLSISPEEIAEIVRHWEPSHPSTGWTFWRKIRLWLLRIVGILALITLISMIWGFYLVRQVRRTRHAEQRAEAANAAKSEFLSTMSHEIRTPLSAVIGLLELAQTQKTTPEVASSLLSSAHEAAQGMLLLLGDVLDVNRIESGRLHSTPKTVALRDLIENMAALMQGLAYRKQLTLYTTIAPSLDCWVTVDPLHLKQILFNLLSNAIKFTQQGSVSLQASATREAQRLQLLLEISDTGQGIALADQKRLFRPYSQVTAAQETQAFGSGLGLHITRRLVEHMGGSISLSSTLGQGSCFTVLLPLPLTNAPMAAPTTVPAHPQTQPPVTSPTLRILVAEDHILNLMVLTQKLEALGHKVTGAEDGQRAWELWQQQSYQVVITDGQMPHSTGVELIQRIRDCEALEARPPCWVVALTASTDAQEQQRYRDVGANDIVLKPITTHTLTQILQQATIKGT